MRPTTGAGTYIIGDERMELVIACYCATRNTCIAETREAWGEAHKNVRDGKERIGVNCDNSNESVCTIVVVHNPD